MTTTSKLFNNLSVLLALCFCLTLTGCGGGGNNGAATGNDAAALVGTWAMYDGTEMVFNEDGTLVVGQLFGPARGTWRTEGNRLFLDGDRGPLTSNFEVSGDTLTITDPDTGENMMVLTRK